MNSMSGVNANVVTITLGDELSGTIAQAVEADVTVAPQQESQKAVSGTTETATPATGEETKETSNQ